MKQLAFGERDNFAIEYRPMTSPPLCGGIRIWVKGLWLGEIESPEMMGHIAEGLNSVRGDRRKQSRIVYACADDVPSFDDLYGRSHWSFGEAFDDFDFVYYAVRNTEQVHFAWRATEGLLKRHPTYPSGMHNEGIKFDVYDRVVGSFLAELHVPDKVAPGVKWAVDPRDSSD
jgi:hypothetical protein